MEIINTNYETLRLTLCLAGGVITLLLSVVAYFLSKQSRLNIGGSGNSLDSLSNYGDIPAEWK